MISRLVEWWNIQSDLHATKQGLALASSLEGKALDAVLELTDTKLNSDTGVANVIAKLDGIFKKNSLSQKIEDIENFENFKRTEQTSIKIT